jgi:hypothetical protein
MPKHSKKDIFLISILSLSFHLYFSSFSSFDYVGGEVVVFDALVEAQEKKRKNRPSFFSLFSLILACL